MAISFGTPGAIQTPPTLAGHLGQGVAFPIRIDIAGRLALSWGEQSVTDAVSAICQTAPGERVMEPDYGGAVGIFDPINPEGAQYQISESVREHEARVDSIDVAVSLGDPSSMNAVASYSIRGGVTPGTLTYPFFIGPAALNRNGA